MDHDPTPPPLTIAPRAVFDRLAERKNEPRYWVPETDGSFSAVTWGEHAEQIRNAALYLSTEMASGDRAAIFAPNRVEWMAAALGIQAMGGVMVPIYGSSTAEQAAYVVDHSDAKVLFVDTKAILARIFDAWDTLPDLRRVVLFGEGLDAHALAADLRALGRRAPGDDAIDRRVISWSRAMAIGAARHLEEPGTFERTMNGVSLDQPGLMLYTSGTSGNPKGVPLTHENVGVNGNDWLACNGPLIGESPVDLLWLPMSHIFGFGEACLGNTLGFTTYMTDPAHVVGLLPEVRPSVFMSVPSVWEKLAMAAMKEVDAASQKEKLKEVTGGRLTFCLSGGAGLKREVKELFHAHGILIVEGYGLTECSPTLTLNRPDAFRFDSVGKPLPSVELRLAEDGEILARGPSIFAGYHKDPEATKDAFTEDGWFKTGDVGHFTEDGFLQIVDRKKDILVTAGGKNVAPANVEVRFRDDPMIEHVVVYGDGKKYLVAGVWLRKEALTARFERDQVPEAQQPVVARNLVALRVEEENAHLARCETIKKFHIFDEPLTVEGGLLTPTLKVRRKKVYERFVSAFEALYA